MLQKNYKLIILEVDLADIYYNIYKIFMMQYTEVYTF